MSHCAGHTIVLVEHSTQCHTVLRETRTEAGLDDAERAMLLTVRQNIAEAALQLPVCTLYT